MSSSLMQNTPLGGLVEKVVSWNPVRDAPDDEIAYIDLGAVDNTIKAVTSFQSILGREAPSRARQRVRAGDILVSTVRPNLNGVARVPIDLDCATASTGFCVLRPRLAKLDAGYLFHWVQSFSFVDDMVRKATGASYPAVSDKIIAQSEIPLPPLEEQKRIAAILDQADELRRNRQRAIDRLNQIDQAIFSEMFGVSNKDAREERLGSLTTKIGSGATPKGGDSSYKVSGTPLIRSMNIRDGHFLGKGLVYIDDDQAGKLDNVVVREGDVLLNITGASVARVCRAPKHMDGARVNQHVSIIRSIGLLSNEFLEAFLLMPPTKTRLLTIAESGATRQAITKAQIEELLIPVPSLEKQLQFAEKVRSVKSSQSGMAAQSHTFDRLFSSLQHRAFSGELSASHLKEAAA